MPIWGGFTIDQIVDGISADCAPSCNGFTTNSKTGLITFTFDKPYDLDGFKLWNDVNLRKEGIRTFRLDFETLDGILSSGPEFTAVSAHIDAQIFNFPTIKNVESVNLHVLSSLNEDTTFMERIEVREIAFTGEPSIEVVLPPVDTTAPVISFNPPSLTVYSQETATATLTVTDESGETTDPILRCDPSGSFSGSTFTAPEVTVETTSICTAVATDAAGNASSGILVVKMLPPPPPPPPPSILPWVIAVALVLLGLGLIGAFWLRRRSLAGKTKSTGLRHPPMKFVRPMKPLERPENAGVIFPASPMLAGNLAAPLAPAGQLAAAQLQMLSGPFAVLKEAYQATGRIGYAQDGIPSAEDYAFGTGFLVSDRHVVTNRHVHGLYGHYLLDKSDPGGIEFIAEKDKDASDFVPFNGEAPLLLPSLDIAIYTLSRPVTNRPPIQLTSIDTEHLLERDIVVVGYPDTHNPEDPEVLAAVEDEPVFAVKRLSQGRVFRHSTDTDTPLGVETSVSESETSNFLMPAICHNASTMGGNSGSPLLDLKDGTLLGVHFAGFKVFNQEEAANLAMAIAQLTQSVKLKSISAVTTITDESPDKV
ncbi:MAG: trypsin-like peptidase domain-containing protein [Litorimonas sp.]